MGSQLGPRVINHGIVYLYFAAVFGFIQRHNFAFSEVQLSTLDMPKVCPRVWDNRNLILYVVV
jgi:hypothetical protein